MRPIPTEAASCSTRIGLSALALIHSTACLIWVKRVLPSGYYDWRDRPEGVRAKANRALLGDVHRLQARHHGRYGSPRMHAALRAEGHGCSRARVERLVRRRRIRALAGRRFRPCTTDSRHHLAVAPNVLAQRFEVPAPGRVWLADISYIATGEGWLYLAVVLDLATRMVVSWSMRDHMPGSADALRRRLNERAINPAILVNNAGFGLSGRLSTRTRTVVSGAETPLP